MSHPPKERQGQGGRQNGPDANPERTQAVRVFYADRLVDTDPGVAVLNIAVTANGMLHTHALGMDPVHASIILDEIDRIRPLICDHIEAHKRSKVVPIRPTLAY